MVGCRTDGDQGHFSRLAALLLGVSFLALALASLAPVAEAAAASPAGELPSPRVGSSAVSVGNGIFYVFGGRSGTAYLDEIVKYDANTGKSQVVAHLPTSAASLTSGRQSAAAVYAKELNKVYVFGGAALANAGDLNGDGTEDYVPKSIPDIVEFDPETNGVRNALPTDQLPQGLWGPGAVWAGDRAFIFGGFTFDIAQATSISRRDWIIEFDPTPGVGQSMTKLTASTLPYKLQDPAVSRFGDQAFIFGGLAENNTVSPCPIVEGENGTMVYQQVCPTAKILLFDFETSIAAPLTAELSQRTQFASAAASRDAVYVFGGRGSNSAAFSTIWEFDPKTKSGKTIFPSLPSGRYGSPAASEGDEIYLFGGRDAGAFSNGMQDVLYFEAGATEPWAPRSLVAAPVSGGGIQLQWREPLYDGGATITGYNVYRIPANGTVQLLGSTPGLLSFKDATARPGEAYVYRVTSVNAKGESPTGVEADTRAETKPPSAPLGFQAFPGDGKVLLRWRAPAETGGSAIGEYRVYRTPTDEPGKPIAFVRPDQFEFTDEDVTNEAAYEYTVAAVNGKGEGAHTPVKAVTPIPVPGIPRITDLTEQGDTLRLDWTISEGIATGFNVYRGTEPDHLALITPEPVSDVAFTDTGVRRGQLYYYAVAGVNTRGEGAWSAITTGGLLDPPAAPKNLLLTPRPGAIDLAWLPLQPSEMGGADGVTYLVERTGPDGLARIIASELTASKHTDRDVIPGVAYKYVIKAFNGRTSAGSTPKTGAAQEIVNEPPVARISSIGGTRFNLSEDVTFDASLSTDDSGRIVEYVWDFGDGTRTVTTTEPIATHKYLRDDHDGFQVTLQVVDALGSKSTNDASVHIYIGAGGNDPTDSSIPTLPPNAIPTGPRPGEEAPGIPAPGFALALAALAAVALVARRRSG